jgi:hypothetical protein
MIYANLIAWKYTQTKKGFTLKIQYGSGGGSAKYLPCKRYVKPEHWDFDNHEPTKKAPPDLKEWVSWRKSKLVKEVNFCNDNNLSLEKSKRVFSDGIQPEKSGKEIGVLEFYDIRIAELENEGRSVRAYKDVKRQLEVYLIGKDVLLSEVDYDFINGFKQFKLKNGVSNNGLLSYLSNFRALYNEAKSRRSIALDQNYSPFAGQMPKKIKGRPQDKVLSYSDIAKLEHYKGLRDESTRHIKMCLFQFYIGGHDYCDLSKLEWSEVRGGRVRFYRHKLRNRGGGLQVDNKILKPALDIIERYGTSDSDRVFDFIPDIRVDEKRYKDHCGNLRRAMRIAFKHLNIDKKALSKTMRHTFRTLARREFIDSDIIMEIQAHNPEGVQYNYQELFPEKEKDAALAQVVLKSEGRSPLSLVG